MRDLHLLPVHFTRHAALMLLERFNLSLRDVRHFLKTAAVVKPVEKDGQVGALEGRIRRRKIRFVFTIRSNAVWIITVEDCT